MISRTRGARVLCVLSLLCVLAANAQFPPSLQKRVQSGDVAPFLELGRTGRAEWRDPIRKLIDSGSLLPEQLLSARMALARLGDEDAFQQITAGFQSSNRAAVLARLRYVRGRNSAAFLGRLLDDWSQPPSSGDSIPAPIAYDAMVTLERIVDYPPFSGGALVGQSSQARERANQWKSWLARQNQTPEEYLARIRNGDDEAFLDMGRRSDAPESYARLISSLLAAGSLTANGKIYALMAAARLGSKEAFDALVDGVRDLSPEQQYLRLDQTRYAPELAVPFLRALLDDTEARANEQTGSAGAPRFAGVGRPIAFRSAMILALMFGQQPASRAELVDAGENFLEYVRLWKDWLDKIPLEERPDR